MLNRPVFLLLLCLMLAAVTSSRAQSSPLVITGNIIDVQVSGRESTSPMNGRFLASGKNDPKQLRFDVGVAIQYCNKGTETIILPNRGSFIYGNRKILFLELPSAGSKVVATATAIDWFQGLDAMPEFVKQLARPEPSNYTFATIEPGSCYESGEWLTVESGFRLESRPNGENRPDPKIVVPEHKYFKIQYALSMKDSLPVSEAKRRWSPIGKLLTTADGDFFLETGVIINKLPE
ncbi:MAG: hypothetical protein WBO10_01770 [Pyrinomonadaceae bacterium]